MALWQPATVIAPSARLAVLAALYGVLGTGLGLLLRNTAAVGLAPMWAFVVEGILPVLTHAPRHGPLAP